MGEISRLASIRCYRTKPAGSWQWISTSRPGKKMLWPSGTLAQSMECRQASKGRDPVMGHMYGFSFQSKFLRGWHGGSVHFYLRRRWNDDPKLALSRMIVSSPIRTRCPMRKVGCALLSRPYASQSVSIWSPRLLYVQLFEKITFHQYLCYPAFHETIRLQKEKPSRVKLIRRGSHGIF